MRNTIKKRKFIVTSLLDQKLDFSLMDSHSQEYYKFNTILLNKRIHYP